MSGKSTTTQTQQSEPWAPAQAALKTGISQGQNLYNSGVGAQVNTASNVVPWSTQTTTGMNSMQKAATANMGSGGLSGQYQSVINNGGFTAPQKTAMGGFGSYANGAGNVDTNPFASVVSQAMAPSVSQRNLSGMASGQYLNNADPNFERALGAASDAAANQVNLSASGMGRYGGAVHQGNLAKTVGDMQAGARAQQYNQNVANMLSANSMIDANRLSGINAGLSALNSRASIQGQNADRVLGAYGQMFNAGQQGISNLGTAYSGMSQPATDMMRVGSMYEDLMARQIDDRNRIFDATQSAPWDNLARLNAIASGAGSLGGTSSGTATAPGQNPFLTGLGVVSSGAGLLGSLFGG